MIQSICTKSLEHTAKHLEYLKKKNEHFKVLFLNECR